MSVVRKAWLAAAVLALASAALFTLPVSPASAQEGCIGKGGYRYTNNRQRNPQPGGWVGPGASVDENVEIAPTAQVCGSAIVRGSSKILGDSIVGGEVIVENSSLQGNVKLWGDVYVKGATLRGFFEASSGEIDGGVHSAPFSKSQKTRDLASARSQLSTVEGRVRSLEASAASAKASVDRIDRASPAFQKSKFTYENCLSRWRAPDAEITIPVLRGRYMPEGCPVEPVPSCSAGPRPICNAIEFIWYNTVRLDAELYSSTLKADAAYADVAGRLQTARNEAAGVRGRVSSLERDLASLTPR